MSSDIKPSQTVNSTVRLQTVLASKGLSLHQASQITENLYGRCSPFFLPHNFYYELGRRSFTPSLHQLSALSRITNYKLADWLLVFGFDLANITRVQVMLTSKHTLLLDPSLDDRSGWITWFESKTDSVPISGIAPMTRLLEYSLPHRVADLEDINNRNFLYARLGHEDLFAFPDLLPGSIVRVNPNWQKLIQISQPTSNQFFLIEHSRGLSCCRLQASRGNALMPVSTQLPYPQIAFQTPDELRVLGLVDAEVRPLTMPDSPDVPQPLLKPWRPHLLDAKQLKFGALLRDARSKSGLSFREVSAVSRQIANLLADEHYFASPGSLSDYETLDIPPRHIHKAITLCAVYGLKWSALLQSVNLQLENSGSESIADDLLGRLVPTGLPKNTVAPIGQKNFLNHLLTEWDSEVPLFLRRSLAGVSGLSHISLNDVFWIAENQCPVPTTRNTSLLALVNRRKKTPIHWRSKPLWQQPIYLLLRRNGDYGCEFCSLENDALILHSYTEGYHRSERLRNRHDAEVIGQVVTLARKLACHARN